MSKNKIVIKAKNTDRKTKVSVELSSDATINECINAFRSILTGLTYPTELVDEYLPESEE